jgi:hypothetical protein
MKSIFWKNVKFLELKQLLNFKHLTVKYSIVDNFTWQFLIDYICFKENMPVKNTMSSAGFEPAHTEVYQSLNLTP